MTASDTAQFDAKTFVKNLPGKPGVYRMFDANGTVIYVGKAVNLKNRVGSYFQKTITHQADKERVSPQGMTIIRICGRRMNFYQDFIVLGSRFF